MGSALKTTMQNYQPLTEQEKRDHILRLLATNKSQSGKAPSVKAPTPSSTFSYNPLPPNMAAAPGLSTAPGLSIAPGLNRVTTQGVASPFAGMSFGGSGLLGLGQATSNRPTVGGSPAVFSPSYGSFGTQGFSPSNGLNLGLGYGMTPHTILLNPSMPNVMDDVTNPVYVNAPKYG